MGPTTKNSKKYIFIFFAAILIHWAIVIVASGFQVVWHHPDNIFSFIWQRLMTGGDTPHYIYIAEHGYQAFGDKAYEIVFFPLFPLMMKGLWFIVRNYLVSGMIISQICFGFSAVFLYKLISIDRDESKAFDSVLLMIFYPFSVFCFGAYTEGLFLMTTIASLYYIRQHKWIGAGIFGFLAALTRTQGVLLLLPAIYEYFIGFAEGSHEAKYRFQPKDLLILGIPFGYGIYLLINKIWQGDWFAFLRHEAAAPFYQTVKWLNLNISKDVSMAIENPALSLNIYWVQVSFFFIALIALFWGLKKKVRTSYILYGGAYLGLSYLAGWLISGGRYMMGCIALYIIYAYVENKWIRNIILFASVLLCLFYTVWFLNGDAIM